LKNKLISTKRSRISEAIVTASQQFKEQPEGSRHVVMITDGVDSPGAKVDREQAMRTLIAARATVHIISYTEFVRQNRKDKDPTIAIGQLPASSDPIRATDPTLPPARIVRLRMALQSGLTPPCAGCGRLMKLK